MIAKNYQQSIDTKISLIFCFTLSIVKYWFSLEQQRITVYGTLLNKLKKNLIRFCCMEKTKLQEIAQT